MKRLVTAVLGLQRDKNGEWSQYAWSDIILAFVLTAVLVMFLLLFQVISFSQLLEPETSIIFLSLAIVVLQMIRIFRWAKDQFLLLYDRIRFVKQADDDNDLDLLNQPKSTALAVVKVSGEGFVMYR